MTKSCEVHFLFNVFRTTGIHFVLVEPVVFVVITSEPSLSLVLIPAAECESVVAANLSFSADLYQILQFWKDLLPPCE